MYKAMIQNIFTKAFSLLLTIFHKNLNMLKKNNLYTYTTYWHLLAILLFTLIFNLWFIQHLHILFHLLLFTQLIQLVYIHQFRFVAFFKLSKPQLYWYMYMYCKVDYNMTIVSPLLGLSWLNRIPLQAYMPQASRQLMTIQQAYSLATPVTSDRQTYQTDR